MNDLSSWSLSLGRWRRLHVRLHALFLAVAVFAFYAATAQVGQESAGYGLLAIAVLFLSVLAHELGHCLAALRVGGGTDGIVIGPLGGLSYPEVPRDPRAELVAALGGVVVSLGIVLVTLPLVIAGQLGLFDLLSPLEPVGLFEGSPWDVLVKLVFWTNSLLVVANLLPAVPLDGARVLAALLWPALDHRSTAHVVVRSSKLTAVGLCILAWLVHDSQPAPPVPAWVVLLVMALWIYFSAARDGSKLDEGEWDDELLNYDFSQGYTSLERGPEPARRRRSFLWRWIDSQRRLRRQRRQFREQDEERQVDEILMRLHEGGMQSLNPKERALLERVSARLRNRQRN